MRGFLFATGVLLASSGVLGCYDYFHDCTIWQCGGDTGGIGGTGGTGGAGGAGCIPSNQSGPVPDSCGVFVSTSGNDMNDDPKAGTQGAPFATIAKALGAAKSKPVYLCAETFSEAVEIKAGVVVYGALDCANGWVYNSSQPTEITAPSDAIPVRVGAKTSAEMYDIVIRAADATAKGSSSIALLAEAEGDVQLSRCSVEAGNGADGEDGQDYAGAADTGSDGSEGAEACSADVTLGGKSIKNSCDDLESISGGGGNGQEVSGGAGSPGAPVVNDNSGKGEIVMACTAGTEGAAGVSGGPGAGAAGLGAISSSGYLGPTATDGMPGSTAQGGGGGGGAKGGTGAGKCADGAKAGGASGASGGAGGCGGLGGKAGGAGGASIAIVSLGASFTFDSVKVTTKVGGNGGNGGNGQPGGPGGLGGGGGTVPNGLTLKAGCDGGPGGKGGDGGRGGGGLGGHSIGIAYTGAAPSTEGSTITKGAPGNGGAGMNEDGDSGVSAEAKEF